MVLGCGHPAERPRKGAWPRLTCTELSFSETTAAWARLSVLKWLLLLIVKRSLGNSVLWCNLPGRHLQKSRSAKLPEGF